MTADQKRIQNLFSRLRRLLKQVASDPEPGKIHHFRTSIRRIESLLTSTAPARSNGHGRLLKQLSKLRRRAGQVRDLDVLISKLEALSMESIDKDKQRVLRAMQKTRARRLKKLETALDSGTVSGLRKRLSKAVKEVLDGSPATPGKIVADPVAFSLERFAVLTEEQPRLTEQNLHEFRKQCKHVRYVAELAENEPAAKPILASLKNIQDAVGDWHDWLTLRETANQALSDGNRSVLVGVLGARTRSKLAEAMRVTEEEKKKLLQKHAQLALRKGPASARKPRSAAQVPA